MVTRIGNKLYKMEEEKYYLQGEPEEGKRRKIREKPDLGMARAARFSQI